MTLVAVVGDCTTTTCIALAAGWSGEDDVLVAEADGSGGSLAAWLDVPTSPSLASVVAIGADAGVDAVRAASVLTRSGVRLLPAPVRVGAARRAVHEAASTLFPRLAATPTVTVLADGGRDSWMPIASAASTVVLVHRQTPASAGAAAVRLERLVEQVEMLRVVDVPLVIAVVGDEPFDPVEMIGHVDAAVPHTLTATVVLPVDPLAAAVLAGRTGVSAKRLARLPLMRAAVTAGRTIRQVHTPTRPLASVPRGDPPAEVVP